MFRKNIRKTVYILIITMLVLSVYSIFAFGADLSEMIRVYRSQANIKIDGRQVAADNFIYNNTIYAPLRNIAEMLGKQVDWDNSIKTADIKDLTYHKEELSRLLPNHEGYDWSYFGFAEYSHEMTLDSIVDGPQKRTYYISGMVGDPSGGESDADYSISLKYIIEGSSLIQNKQEEMMLDSKFDSLTLIRTPLVEGNFWNEKVTDKEGMIIYITSTIEQAVSNKDGYMEYTVKYQDQESSYFEQRVIREGTGTISFDKLFEAEEDYVAGYNIYEPRSQEDIELELYFPGSNAEKVWIESRLVTVYNNEVARAAVKALIQGPETGGLSPCVPENTKDLSVSILNGICTIDLSSEFIEDHSGGSAGELMTLASIVNTLTEFPSIQKVMILVEGQAGATLGNIILDKALDRMSDLIGQ